MRNSIVKNYLTKLLCAVLILCMMLTMGMALVARAATEDEEDREFSEKVFTEQFANSSGWPGSPSGWTGEYAGGISGTVVSGIIPLDSNYTSNYDSFKLKRYPEYAKDSDIPKTPFGGVSSLYEGTNRNVLMINTDGSQTAYGYSYSSTNLAANSYYRFSVYVKTGMFPQGMGAAITLKGLKEPVGIWNIDTVSYLPRQNGIPVLPDNNKSMYGWEEYRIYVATGPNSESATLMLSVGDHAQEHYYPSEGYAFFDNITADKLSPTNYYADIQYLTDDDNVCIYDMNPVVDGINPANDPDNKHFHNGGFDPVLGSWKKAVSKDEDEETNSINWGYYNAGNRFIDNNSYGMKKDPFTPTGKNNDDKCIMVLSSFYKVKDENTNEFKSVKAGVVSDPFVIKRERFYMLSFWYNTESISGGAAAVITGENTTHSQQYKLPPVSVSGLSSDGNKERYGWQRGNFYIRGSLIKDIKLNLELWLGYDSEASGIAMFDQIALSEIDYFEFTENKLGGQVVTIDSYQTSGTITNSVFSDVEYEKDDDGIKAKELTYPAKPSNWTFIDTHTAGTTGYSSNLVEINDENNMAHGVVPTETEHYAAHRGDYLNLANPSPYNINYVNKNVLMIASTEPAAFGYKSPSFSINTNEQQALNVNMKVKIDSGYGACLILKKDNKIVATIEKIKDTGGVFRNYTFYLAGGSQQATLTVEIWLGMLDKNVNMTKLTQGCIFVNSVDLESISPDESGVSILETKAKEYNNINLREPDYAMYCPGTLDFSGYDRFSDQAVRDAYDITVTNTGFVRAGMLGLMPEKQVEINNYQKIYAEHLKTEYHTESMLYMRNIDSGYSRLQGEYAVNLAADTRYRVDFSILVDLYDKNDDGRNVGAGIWLGEHGFENIRETYRTPYTIIGYDAGKKPVYQKELEFKQYSFYFATSDTEETLNWAVTLGGSDYSYQHIAGRIFINSIAVTEINSDAFDEIETAQEKLEDDKKDPQILIVNKTVATTEAPVDDTTDTTTDTTGTTTDPNSNPWYYIPSILLVIAMVIALGGVIIKKWLARSPRAKGREKVVSYDRRRTLNRINSQTDDAEAEDKPTYITGDTTFDSFDDETAAVQKKARYTTAETVEATETAGTETSEAVAENSEGVTLKETESVTEESRDIKKEIKSEAKKENEFDD